MLKKIFLVLFICLGPSIVRGQLAFDHLSVMDGLSQSSVLSIIKDSRGYMWFGTRENLNRYDGRTIKVYKTEQNNPASISSENYIYALHEDQKQNLWIGTQNGLNRYIPESDSFERIPFEPADEESISDRIVLSITSGNKGRIWFGTNNGLSLLKSSSSRKFKRYFSQDGLAGNEVYAIYEDSKENVWVGTKFGLTIMTPQQGGYTFKTFVNSKNDPNSISENSIKTILEDRHGNIWIGTEREGINLYNPQNQSFIRFKNDPLNNKSLSNNYIRKIIEDKNGLLWVATMSGLNIFDTKRKEFGVYRHDSENSTSLSNNSIKDVYEDNHGSIWVGTMFGGVNVTHKSTIPFIIERHSKYRNSISSNIISVIHPDRNGNLWIGTEGQGLNYYNTKSKKYKHYTNDPLDPSSLSSNTIKAVFIDSHEQLWIGMFEGGLDLFIPSSGRFRHYRPDRNLPNSISQGYVSSIAEDKNGDLWVGTASNGLNRFDRASQSFTVFTSDPSSKLRLSSNYIRIVYSDSKGNLWVGTANGLNLLAVNEEQFTSFYKNSTSKDSLQSSHITSVKEDSKGNIWIGSFHGGLSQYKSKTKSFVTYTTKDGIASDNVIDIIEDDDGNLWISTDRGLSKFDTKTKKFKNYSTKDGLPTNEFNFNSAYKDESGKLYFGSYNGLVAFRPQEFEENKNVPEVVFSGLKLFNKPVMISGPDKLLKKAISFTEEITFSANQNIFTIEFLALNYIKPGQNQFSYKLEGFEKDWNFVSVPSATYTNLPPGKYNFLVRASNNDGLWNLEPATLIINILPPIWKTWWAYLSYLIILSIILFFLVRFLRRQDRLETELFYEHLNNKNQQKLHQVKLDFFTRISHEIRTPLTLISAPLENLISHTIDNKAVHKQLLQIKNNSDRLIRLINELLDFRKIETGNMKIMVSEQDVVSFCRDVFFSFKDLSVLKDIDYTFKSSKDTMYAFIDVAQMEKVLYNILSNAFKYTQVGGRIEVSLIEEDDWVQICVKDDGIGITKEEQQNIFTNFYQVNHPSEKKEGWGIGLALAKNIIDGHHGEIIIKSQAQQKEKKGQTAFIIKLRKGSENFESNQIISIPFNNSNSSSVKPGAKIDQLDVEPESEQAKDKKFTILIIEDNDELRLFLKESLEDTYHIIESDNGTNGWELGLAHVPDIIISDVNMEGMNGLELCRKLKSEETTSHIPIIMLTAMAEQMHRVGGLEAGADIYITKPFSIQVLQLSLKNILASREALQQKYSRQVMLMPKKIEIESPDEKFLNNLMSLVEKNMENPDFNVSTLVSQSGMSQTVLYKKVKALTDISITDLIKTFRLKRAAQLLKESKLSVAEVAYSVGFNDRKYFSKEFKKQFGFSPSEYGKSEMN